MVEKKDNFKFLIVMYTLLMGVYQVADYFYGISYMIMLNSSLSVRNIAIIIGIKEVCTLIFDFPSGVISDYVGRKKTAALSLILYGGGLILLTICKSFLTLLLVFVLIAFATAMFSGSPQAWFYDTLLRKDKLSERERIIPKMSGAVKLITTGANIAAIAFVIVNKNLPLIIGGIAVIVFGILFLFIFEDNKGKHVGNNFFSTMKEFSVSFFADERMRGMLYFESFDYAAFSVFIFTWQLFVLNKFSLTEKAISVLFVCFTLVMALGNFVTSFLHKYLDGYTICILGRIGMIISFVILFATNNLWVAIGGFLIFEMFFSITNTSISIWRNDYISSDNRASFYSGISSVKTLLAILITFCLGSLIDTTGYRFVWAVALICEFTSLLFTMRFINKFRELKGVSYE